MPAAKPATLGNCGYMVVITAGYSLFQTANNTAVTTNVRPGHRGVFRAASLPG
jgi:hypothetical protein